MGKYRSSRQTLPWLASFAHSDGHEWTNSASPLCNTVFPKPPMSSNPTFSSWDRRRGLLHSTLATMLTAQPLISPSSCSRAAGLGLPVRTYGHQYLISCCGHPAPHLTLQDPLLDWIWSPLHKMEHIPDAINKDKTLDRFRALGEDLPLLLC